MTDAQRKAFFVDIATTAGIIVVIQNNYGGAQITLFIPVPGLIKLVTNDDTLNSAGIRVYLSIVPCASSSETSQCEEAAAIWVKCPMRVAGIAQLFNNGNTKCVIDAFVACSIVRMRKDGSIISASSLTLKMGPCPSECKTSPIDASSCTAGSLGSKGSDGSCACTVPKTSVVSGSTSTNSSTSSGGSNTGLFYIIFVLMIIPIALLIAACLYYYFYHYRPARESEQYLAPCCAAPGYAYPPQMLTNTPAMPVAYI